MLPHKVALLAILVGHLDKHILEGARVVNDSIRDTRQAALGGERSGGRWWRQYIVNGEHTAVPATTTKKHQLIPLELQWLLLNRTLWSPLESPAEDCLHQSSVLLLQALLLQALLLQVLLREQSLPWQTQFDTMLQPSTQHFEWHFCWRASLQDNCTYLLLMKGVDKRVCKPTPTSALCSFVCIGYA